MTASAGIRRKLCVNDLVVIYQSKAIERQHGFYVSECGAKLVFRFDTFGIDICHGFFHMVEVTVYQVCDRFGTPVGHCFEVKRTNFGNGIISGNCRLSCGHDRIEDHHRHQ